MRPLALAAVLALGRTAFGQQSPPDDSVAEQSGKFARVYALIEKNYVEAPDPDAAILEGGVRGMLATLDPFSAFLNAQQFQQLQQQMRGHAVGFGTILYVTPGKLIVLQAAEKSPAARAGLGPGDEIVEVNGQRVAHLDFQSLVALLEQARSHPVVLGILHPGKLVPTSIKLNPAQVALPTVDIACELKPGTAYVHVTSFEDKTPQEILDAIEHLGGKNLKGLVLDLRGNHGGVVEAAINTVSLFLPPGERVMSVKGRSQEEKFAATVAAPATYTFPVVVLVNGETASAAEIAAAALEEHDRAVIAGSATFGKGLVQAVMPLDEKMGLALITAQYFTPSGRSIQRPLPGTALADPQQERSSGRDSPNGAFHTENGRSLSAGGGITPDIEIPALELDPWEQFLDQRGLFTNFASEYLTRHPRITKSFEPDDQTLDEFRDFLRRTNVSAPGEYWDKDKADLKLRIKIEAFDLVFGLAAGNIVQTLADPQVEKAAALLGEAPEILKPGSARVASGNVPRVGRAGK